MLNRILAIALCVLISLGCSVPAEDDMAQMKDAINNAPLNVRQYLFQFAANKWTHGYLSGFDRDRDAFDIQCERSGKETIDTVKVRDILRCLEAVDTRTYGNCRDDAVSEAKRRHPGSTCFIVSYEVDFDPKYLSDKANPLGHWRNVADVLLALTAVDIANNPHLMDALGLSSVGGALVAMPYSIWFGIGLCALSDSVRCPDNPGATAIPQHGTGGGGDR